MRTPKDPLITIELHKSHILVRPVSADAAKRIQRMKRDNNHDAAWTRLLHRLGPEWRYIELHSDERWDIGMITDAPVLATGEGETLRAFYFNEYALEDEFEALASNLPVKFVEAK